MIGFSRTVGGEPRGEELETVEIEGTARGAAGGWGKPRLQRMRSVQTERACGID